MKRASSVARHASGVLRRGWRASPAEGAGGGSRRAAVVRCWVVGALGVSLSFGGAPQASAATTPEPGAHRAARDARRAPQPAPRTHVLLVTGAAGEPAFAERFEEVGATLVDALRGRAGLPAAQVVWLAEDPRRDPTRISGRSRKPEVEQALARLATEARAGDQVLVVLVGHGSHEGPESRLNLPGPDITAAEIGRRLDAIRGARVAIVNAASASGDFVGVLAKPGRIVIAATRSAMERNETRFAEHFAQAFAGDGADTDKDGRVSLLEAFVYARGETVKAYERDRRLLTEHAVLDDDGDGAGSDSFGAGAKDGRLARGFTVAASAVAARPAAASGDPRVAALAARRDTLERQVAAHRARRDGMAAAAYERELERLLVALAEATRALRAAERTPP